MTGSRGVMVRHLLFYVAGVFTGWLATHEQIAAAVMFFLVVSCLSIAWARQLHP